jgi:exonuclease SbcD
MDKTTMKILHTSDWHLGRTLHDKSLLEDQRHALNQVLDIVRNTDHHMLIIAGDVFDRAIPPAEAVSLFSEFLTELRGFSDIPVIIIPGNHDSAARLSFCSGIMSSSGIHFITDVGQSRMPLRISSGGETAHVYAIPFLNPSVLDIHGEDETSGNNSHDSAMARVMADIRADMSAEIINICVGHLFARNGVTSESERIFIGSAGDVDIRRFDDFHYTALGHLHRPQAVTERARYCGSLLKYSFSECGDMKGLLSVTVGGDKNTVENLPINPLHDMARLSGSFMDLLRSEKFAEYGNCYVEAELTDHAVISNAISSLRDRFPHILSVRQKPAQSADTGEARPVLPGENRTIEGDYRIFHEYIHGEEPSDEALKLFHRLHGEAESE